MDMPSLRSAARLFWPLYLWVALFMLGIGIVIGIAIGQSR